MGVAVAAFGGVQLESVYHVSLFFVVLFVFDMPGALQLEFGSQNGVEVVAFLGYLFSILSFLWELL